jgi:hypothetical protein
LSTPIGCGGGGCYNTLTVAQASNLLSKTSAADGTVIFRDTEWYNGNSINLVGALLKLYTSSIIARGSQTSLGTVVRGGFFDRCAGCVHPPP